MESLMIAPGPADGPGSEPAASGDTGAGTGLDGGPDRPLMALRGAGVDVDSRRAGRGVAAALLFATAVAVAVLFVAGVQKNAQITRLHDHGVGVVVTVTRCIGLMGGSGSNLAGYQCRGAFTINGHRYDENLPGGTPTLSGATFRAVADPSDPALLSTRSAVAAEHASWRVFALPLAVLAVMVLTVVAWALKRRSESRAWRTPHHG
jgi:MFS superfamily sulfate permease-like transporter